MKQIYGWGKTVNAPLDFSTSTAPVVESPTEKERNVVVPSRSAQKYLVPERGHTLASMRDDEVYSM